MAETSISERANAWVVGDDTGSSSQAIWAVMMGARKPPLHAYPSDGGDLGRCLRLLDLIPEWKTRLKEMAAVSPYWAALVEHWDDLAARYAEDRDLYLRMKQILDPIEAKDQNIVKFGKGMSLRFGR